VKRKKKSLAPFGQRFMPLPSFCFFIPSSTLSTFLLAGGSGRSVDCPQGNPLSSHSAGWKYRRDTWPVSSSS